MMFKRFPLVIAIALAVVAISVQGCVSEPDLENYPVVSFTNEVQPIIAGNCTQSGCHGEVDTEEFKLITYNDIMGQVSAGNARKSELYRVITGRSLEFMPPSPSRPLTEDHIRSIFVWIEQGAPNN